MVRHSRLLVNKMCTFSLFVLTILWRWNSCNAEAVDCGYPGSPAHATVTFSSDQWTPGTIATYTCDNGYELLGPVRRECFDNGTWIPQGIPFCVLNVAAGKAPLQSSTMGHGIPQKAIDGTTSHFFDPNTCSLTEAESSPWWYVNLLEPYVVQLVRIDFGTSCCDEHGPATIVVRVGNNRPDLGVNPICNKFTGFIEAGRPLFLPCTAAMPGAFVSVHFSSQPAHPLSICEMFVYTDQALPIERCPHFRDQPLGSTATYNGKCYIFYSNQPTDFNAANKFCSVRSGSLVDETSPALQGFLSWELYRRHRNDPSGQYWMGAVRDPKDPTNWKWVNGRDVTISFWNLPGNNQNCSRFDGARGWLWSDTNCDLNLNYICQHRPTSCGKPERPSNSTIMARNFEVGSVIEYRCAPGHLLVGPNIRTCLPNGFYSEFPPKCRYLECGPPAPIPHGSLELVNGTRHYLSVVRYACSEGFVLVGRSQLVCDVDERWNGPPPRCEPVLCRAPPDIMNAHYQLSSQSTVYGTTVDYACNPGFELEDGSSSRLRCSSSGFWEGGELPRCVRQMVPITFETTPPPFISTTKRMHPSFDTITTPIFTTTFVPVTTPTTTTTTLPTTTTTSTTTTSTTTTTTSTPRPRPRPPSLFPHRKQPTAAPVTPLHITTPKPPIHHFRPPPHNSLDPLIAAEDRQRPQELDYSGAKLNMGGFIALGVFGGFVVLAAVITIIVIVVRRTRSVTHRRRNVIVRHGDGGGHIGPYQSSTPSPDHTLSTVDDSTGLHKYYKRAWDNLGSEQTKPKLQRLDTLDTPPRIHPGMHHAAHDGYDASEAHFPNNGIRPQLRPWHERRMPR